MVLKGVNMEIENRLKTALTAEEQQAVQRIAEIAESGWPVFGVTMHPDAIELIERSPGGNPDEITMAFGGAGGCKLVIPRGALKSA